MSIYEKLYKVKSEIGRVAKSTKAYKYKYATLDQCHDEIDPVLEAHRLVWLTLPKSTADGRTGVQYRLVDLDSGDSIEGDCLLPVPDPDPQKCGGAITYARRYALAAVGLLTEEDDDAAKASTRKPARYNAKREAAKYLTDGEKAEVISACRAKADIAFPDNSELADEYFKTVGKSLVENMGVPSLGEMPAGKLEECLTFIKDYRSKK